MARLTLLEPPDEQGLRSSVINLELDGWCPPEDWEDIKTMPQWWPANTVAALIELWLGSGAGSADEVVIPDILAWHITSLIELLDGINYPYTLGHEVTPTPDLVIPLSYQHPDATDADLRKMAHEEHVIRCARQARHIAGVVQQWYAAGIALYTASRMPRP